MAKQRADIMMVEQGLAPTRARAQALILAGSVVREGNQQRIEKAGEWVPEGTALALLGAPIPYVSRGGLKLQRALQHFHIEAQGLTCLDVGASTGGFTDCLLQHGAHFVYALDVGHNQMAWSLRQDGRVKVIERTHVRKAADDVVPELVQMVVIDVSFISLQQVLPAVTRWAGPSATLVALIKPQFEVGPQAVGKGGIVTSEEARERAVADITACTTNLGLDVLGVIPSPITGAKGNIEFLMAARFAPSHNSGKTR